MESISFAPNSNAQSIYNTTIKRVSSEEAKDVVEVMFRCVALLDHNTELSDQEAEMIRDALNKHDHGRLLSLGIDYVRYDSNEVSNAWYDFFRFSLDKFCWQYLEPVKNHFARYMLGSFLEKVRANLTESEWSAWLEDGEKIIKYLQDLANHPKSEIADLDQFLSLLYELYHEEGYFDPGTGKPKPDADVPGFNKEYTVRRSALFMRDAAKYYHDLYIFEHDWKEKLRSNYEDLAFLKYAAQNQNEYLAARALIALGKQQARKEMIQSIIRKKDRSLLVTASAFEALMFVKDEQTVDFLLDCLRNSSFRIMAYARKALVHHRAPDIVLKRLSAELDSADSFRRGEAASLLKYFGTVPQFAAYRRVVYAKLRKICSNRQEDPLVRITARQTLESLKSGKAPKLSLPAQDLNDASYTTFFFRYPKQLGWIVEKVRERAVTVQNSSEIIRVLSVGCSMGAEPLSIIMAVMEDYQKNSGAWGNFDPRTRFKVIATDIDLDVLRFLKRGECFTARFHEFNDIFNVRGYAEIFGGGGMDLFEQFFDYDDAEKKHVFKNEYRNMIQIQRLDIVAGDRKLNNKSWIVVYNNVAVYLDHKERLKAAEQLYKLSQEYITYTDAEEDGLTEAGPVFEKTTRVYSAGFLYMVEKKNR